MRATDFDAWLLDLDGVVYVGHELLPGVRQALAEWRNAGKEIRFLTNDPRPTREELAARLQRLGVETCAEEIVTCGWATAQLLPELGVQSAYVVGSRGLAEELQRAGITITRDGAPDAVVVGADEELRFLDVVQGCLLVQRGARFIATNADPSYPMPFGTVPATGAVVCAIRLATGQRPLVVGKPEPLMFQLALRTLPPGSKALVVGDRIESDILGAHRAGLPAVLVAETVPNLPAARDLRRPDAVVRSLVELLEQPPELPVGSSTPDPWPERVVAGVVLLLVDEARERLALVPAGGEWSLPWTILEPLETFEEAASRILRRVLTGEAQRFDLAALVSQPEVMLVTDRDGALVRLAGPAFLAQTDAVTLAGDARWHPIGRLEELLSSTCARWVWSALASYA